MVLSNPLFVWMGIILCLAQSASFSGLNLACFSINKLSLDVEAAKGNVKANKLLSLRKDANFLLATILWGNVAVNVLLALLSNSVLTGMVAFLFSTVVITLAGEILPQGYFSRHALTMASRLAPLLRFYQVLLFPVSKPSALLLDAWLGPEAIKYYTEADVRKFLEIHAKAPESDIDRVESRGALNFLAFDDLPAVAEGENVDPESIVAIDFQNNQPLFPQMQPTHDDPLLQKIHKTQKKWIIFVDQQDDPRLALNADTFLRDALFNQKINPLAHCHRPIVVRDTKQKLGDIITRLKVEPEKTGDDVIDKDLILIWSEQKKVITGSDILGRLMRGIVQQSNS